MMLDVRDLCVDIGKTSIVRNISFTVRRGEFFALIGPNGSGKSTILKAISRIIASYRGGIFLDSRDSRDYRPREYARKVSAVSQHHRPIEGLMVREMVAYGRIPHCSLFGLPGRRDEGIIARSIDEVDLADMEHRLASTLSGGELQRVHLAASFCQEPELLLLDEPTNHLDVRHQYNILRLVRTRATEQNVAVLCVLHDINQALQFADRIAMLQGGEIRFAGTPEEIISGETVSRVFGIESRVHRGDAGPVVEFIGSR
jgi:iron complex transport system ATP-binding protein